ncbi:restriction endonuclease subunit S [Limosilactobacillus allomucosae]|uniref:Restriction endonuclease subunit S n=1 Tax=Limosilactobacillus allomucosae TaxID=3142938 RepID=A0ABV0I5F3_9LACO
MAKQSPSYHFAPSDTVSAAGKHSQPYPWEQRKLGEIGETFSGLSGKNKNDFGHGDASFITYMNVFSNSIADLRGTEHVEIDSKQNQVMYGDILFTTSSETPEEVGMSSVWLGHIKNIYLNSFCFGYRILEKQNFDSYYMAYLLRAENFRKRMTVLAQGISRYNISKKQVMNTFVNFPTMEEQRKIGKALFLIDKTITLHEEKQRQLEQLKKALLQKMFADKTGYPALRFKGFTAKWEQRKLGEIADFNPKEDLPVTFEYVDLESVSGTTMITHRTEQKSSAPSRAQRLARLGDLFYQNVRPYQKNNYLFDKTDHTYVFSTGYTQMRPIVNGYFLLTLVQRQNFVDKVLKRCTGTSYPAINSKDLSRIKVLIPSTSVNFHSGILDKADMNRSDTNEAEKIGQLFQSLDKTITLHDKKIQYLKQLKRGLLQKMFV